MITSQINMVPNASGANFCNVVSWLLYSKACQIYDSTEIDRKEGAYDLDGVAPFGNRTDTSDCPYPSHRLSGGTATQAA